MPGRDFKTLGDSLSALALRYRAHEREAIATHADWNSTRLRLESEMVNCLMGLMIPSAKATSGYLFYGRLDIEPSDMFVCLRNALKNFDPEIASFTTYLYRIAERKTWKNVRSQTRIDAIEVTKDALPDLPDENADGHGDLDAVFLWEAVTRTLTDAQLFADRSGQQPGRGCEKYFSTFYTREYVRFSRDQPSVAQRTASLDKEVDAINSQPYLCYAENEKISNINAAREATRVAGYSHVNPRAVRQKATNNEYNDRRLQDQGIATYFELTNISSALGKFRQFLRAAKAMADYESDD